MKKKMIPLALAALVLTSFTLPAVAKDNNPEGISSYKQETMKDPKMCDSMMKNDMKKHKMDKKMKKDHMKDMKGDMKGKKHKKKCGCHKKKPHYNE